MPVCRVCAVWSVCFVSWVHCVSCVWRLCSVCCESLPSEEGEVKGDESGVMGTPPAPEPFQLQVEARGPALGMVSRHTYGGGGWGAGVRAPAFASTDGLAGGNQCNTLQNKLQRRHQAETWAVGTNQPRDHGWLPDSARHSPSGSTGGSEPRRPDPTVCVHLLHPDPQPSCALPLPVHFWGLCDGLLSPKSLTFSPPFPKATCVQGVPWDHVSAKGP